MRRKFDAISLNFSLAECDCGFLLTGLSILSIRSNGVDLVYAGASWNRATEDTDQPAVDSGLRGVLNGTFETQCRNRGISDI